MQLVMVFESNPQAQIDYLYVSHFLEHNYPQVARNKVKLTPIYAKSKTNLTKCGKRIIEVTNQYSFTHGPKAVTKIIIFADSDVGDEGQKINKRIKDYCQSQNFSLVWFHRDVEEVFLGERPSKKEKKREAIRFVKEKLISKVRSEDLSCEISDRTPFGKSNIKTVFDRVFSESNR